MHPIPAALVWLCGPLLVVLHALHRRVDSWGGVILLLLVLVRALGMLCTLLAPGKKERQQLEEEAKALAISRLRGDFRAALTQDAELRLRAVRFGRHAPVLWVLGKIQLLSHWYAYLGLYVILLYTPDLRGAKMAWIPDLSAPDPLYILPLCVLGYWAFGVILSERSKKTEREARPNWLLRLMPLGWAGINALLPAGGCLYHLASCLFIPAITLLMIVPFFIKKQLERLGKALARK